MSVVVLIACILRFIINIVYLCCSAFLVWHTGDEMLCGQHRHQLPWPTVPYCVPPGATVCHCVSLCVTVCHCVPLCANVCHCVPLCAFLCDTMCRFVCCHVCHCVPSCVPLCAFLCATVFLRVCPYVLSCVFLCAVLCAALVRLCVPHCVPMCAPYNSPLLGNKIPRVSHVCEAQIAFSVNSKNVHVWITLPRNTHALYLTLHVITW